MWLTWNLHICIKVQRKLGASVLCRLGVRYFDILFRYSRLHLSQLMWLCDDNHQSRVSGEWSGGGQPAVFIPGVWRHHTRQLGPDIISTVISVIILIMKTFHVSIASLYLRQCRGCDDVNHRSGIRTDTTCHNRYTRHTTHHCSAL